MTDTTGENFPIENISSIKELFTTVEKIGSGGEGIVYKVISNSDHKIYALKKYIRGSQFQLIQKRIEILNKLDSPYISKYHQIFMDQSTKFLYEVMEYSKFDLTMLIKNDIQRYFNLTRKIMRQILEAEKCLFNNKIIHRDIKPQNILISKNGNIMLSDFGLATDLTNANDAKHPYTLYYRPPEVFLRDSVTPASEIWAIACVFYEMLTKTILFKSALYNEKFFFNNMLRIIGTPTQKDYPDWTNLPNAKLITSQAKLPSTLEALLDKTIPSQYDDLKPLLLQMLSTNPENRPTIDQLLEHPFFNNIDDVEKIDLTVLAEKKSGNPGNFGSPSNLFAPILRPPLPLISV